MIVKQPSARPGKRYWWRGSSQPPRCNATARPGDACVFCEKGRLSYDGLFQLVCDRCGRIAEAGTFT